MKRRGTINGLKGARVGLIGAGLMGLAMAERLCAGGHDVLGWDISSAQRSALSNLGGAVAGNSNEVFTRCNHVILSLPDDDVVTRVLTEASPALRAGQIVMDTSSGAPDTAAKIDRLLAPRGVDYLDATVSGNSEQARHGEVVMMVGGSRAAFEKCQELFRLFAKHIIHTGPCGSGAKMKLITNLVLGLNRAALAEGLVFARSLGLNDEQALQVLRDSMAYSRIMDAKGEKMVQEDFEPHAKLSQHLKDVRLMIEAAAKTNTKLPLSETHRDILVFGEQNGLGQLDNSAIIRAIELLKNLRPY
ncbi:MAG TPA: NAD(P)-dependent oxidoreductase [Haliangiales bacterium]|nr:NAD(P)-dependent oxidoreductase [Haliangiales bacterium]